MSSERGQATVELALVLPVVVVLCLVVAQVTAVATDAVLVHHAAREAARAAAVDPEEGVARRAALGAAGLRADRVRVEITGGRTTGDTLTVVVTYSAPTELPLVGRMIDDVELGARVAVRVE